VELREQRQTTVGWAQVGTGQKGRGGNKKKEKVLSILKNNQTNEFKHKFEFKHSKATHQHVCNIKLL
jgi:hypothetical protein